ARRRAPPLPRRRAGPRPAPFPDAARGREGRVLPEGRPARRRSPGPRVGGVSGAGSPGHSTTSDEMPPPPATCGRTRTACYDDLGRLTPDARERMNEQQWLTGNAILMLWHLRGEHGVARKKVGRRKLRLFVVACFRRFWEHVE